MEATRAPNKHKYKTRDRLNGGRRVCRQNLFFFSFSLSLFLFSLANKNQLQSACLQRCTAVQQRTAVSKHVQAQSKTPSHTASLGSQGTGADLLLFLASSNSLIWSYDRLQSFFTAFLSSSGKCSGCCWATGSGQNSVYGVQTAPTELMTSPANRLSQRDREV